MRSGSAVLSRVSRVASSCNDFNSLVYIVQVFRSRVDFVKGQHIEMVMDLYVLTILTLAFNAMLGDCSSAYMQSSGAGGRAGTGRGGNSNGGYISQWSGFQVSVVRE